MKYFQHILTNEVREAFYNPDLIWYREITEAEAKGKPRQRGYVTQSTNRRDDDDLVEDIVGAGIQIGLSLLGGNDDDNGFSGGGGSFGGAGASGDW